MTPVVIASPDRGSAPVAHSRQNQAKLPDQAANGAKKNQPNEPVKTSSPKNMEAPAAKQNNTTVTAQQTNQPVGNNGTVKIDGLEFDQHPDNEPHPGCIFQVDFYNFDRGNFNANVTFEAQPPSGTGVLLNDTVFVGGDPAGGGRDIDAERTYNLNRKLNGLKRQKNQGYHIKVTVDLPNVPGAGKHKVFWVDCAAPVNLAGISGQANPVSPAHQLVGPEVLPNTGVFNERESYITIVGIALYLSATLWASRRLKYPSDFSANAYKPLSLGVGAPNNKQVVAATAMAFMLAFAPILQTGAYGSYQVAAYPAIEAVGATGTVKELTGKPVRIVIPSLGVDVAVIDGSYSQNTRRWSVAGDAANYATNSAPTNNVAGKTLIYGHNTTKVFRALSKLSQGDLVLVYTDNGHIFTYLYNAYAIVAPTDATVFNELAGIPGLKLMTCDGKQAQSRRIVSLDLVNAQ